MLQPPAFRARKGGFKAGLPLYRLSLTGRTTLDVRPNESAWEGFAPEFFAGLLGLHRDFCIRYPAESAVHVDSQCLQIP